MVRHIDSNKCDCDTWWFFIAALLAGLATASKWSSLYILVPALLAFLALRKDIKELPIFLVIASLAYIASFAIDFVHGSMALFVEHHIKMIKYMGQRHKPTFPLFLNGLLTIMFKISVWHHRGIEYLTIKIANSTIVNYSLTYESINRTLIEFEPWLGSFGWIIALFYLLRLVRDSLRNKDPWLVIASATLGSLVLPLLHGNLGWYYLFYAALAPTVLCHYVSKKGIILLVAMNITQIALLELGLINPKYSFELFNPPT